MRVGHHREVRRAAPASPGASACAGRAGASGSSRRRRSCGTASRTCRTPPRASTPSTSRRGRRLWAQRRQEPNDGPNGLALVGDRLYAASDTSVFALDASDGHQLWSTQLVSPTEQFVNITPVVDRGRVYVSTVGLPPGGRGAIYALDAATGKQLWRFDTIKEPWRNPTAGGGGAWEPLSVDGSGRVYAGIANPAPWGGSRRFPNGGWYRGQTLYTDSLVVLDGAQREAPLVRPGASARRQGLRPPALARPRDGGGTRPRDRRGEGRAHLRLGSGHARADLDAAPWERTATTSARCRRRRSRCAPASSAAPSLRWPTRTAGSSSRSSSSACRRAR